MDGPAKAAPPTRWFDGNQQERPLVDTLSIFLYPYSNHP